MIQRDKRNLKLLNSFKRAITKTLVEFFLKLNGYEIICQERHQRIDLVAKRENILVLIEIKRRKSFKSALYSLSYSQKSKIEKISEQIVKKHRSYNFDRIRFDQILVNKEMNIYHLKNSWL